MPLGEEFSLGIINALTNKQQTVKIGIFSAALNMLDVIQGRFRHEEYNMCIGFSSSAHGSTADKRPLFTLCGS